MSAKYSNSLFCSGMKDETPLVSRAATIQNDWNPSNGNRNIFDLNIQYYSFHHLS